MNTLRININKLFDVKRSPETVLYFLAALFLFLASTSITLSPSVKLRSFSASLNWAHWLFFLVWLLSAYFVNSTADKFIPNRDRFLLPLIYLMTGWGGLTIWRLTPYFGGRQTLWLAVVSLIVILGIRSGILLQTLRRFKYVWLFGIFSLILLTFVLGTNPMGIGPKLWLGCCGVYFQPSEPLKLLLIIYLAAYLSSRLRHGLAVEKVGWDEIFPLLFPTFIISGIAISLLIAQRDLGAAILIVFIYSFMLYIAVGRKRILMYFAGLVFASGLIGYNLYNVIETRISAWLNPWVDASGNSYQIVQSLIAIANGGIFGRGLGVGNPDLVPVSHSDYIFTSISEEFGLVGSIGLLLLLAFVAYRGFLISFKATNRFYKLTAAGITLHIVGQSILIIGGNIRLLPLTGVTMPFLSYGGSSLLVSFIEVLILLLISNASREKDRSQRRDLHIFHVGSLLMLGIFASGITLAWWGYVRGPDLLTRTDNARRSLQDRSVHRGSILDASNQLIAQSVGEPGEYQRSIYYPALGNIVGYTHPFYGQTGIEETMDDYLRGLEGSSPLTLWYHHLLYGQSPPGRDIRLTIDLELQKLSDTLLQEHIGALVLIDTTNGEIKTMSSRPSYNPEEIEENWEELLANDDAPLLNRVFQGAYPTGDILETAIIQNSFESLNFPEFGIEPRQLSQTEEKITSPFEIALLAVAISNHGNIPSPSLVSAIHHESDGWTLLPSTGENISVMTSTEANRYALEWQSSSYPIWYSVFMPLGEDITWFVGGTMPTIDGPSYAIVLIIEEINAVRAEEIGVEMLLASIAP